MSCARWGVSFKFKFQRSCLQDVEMCNTVSDLDRGERGVQAVRQHLSHGDRKHCIINTILSVVGERGNVI